MRKDCIQNFMFKDRFVRGSFVCLDESYQTIINQHHYPPLLGKILGEALLGACLISPFFKIPGKVTLQFQGEGDLRLLTARITSDYKIRGLIRSEPHLVSDVNLQHALNEGQLSLTYEPDMGQPYQSYIPIEQPSVARALQDYFMRSEQLSTAFFLATTEERAVGIMFQVLPSVIQDKAYQDFEHCKVLAETLKDEELLNLDLETILHRLFSEDDIMIYAEKPIEFGCNCSRDRMERIVINLGEEEAQSILAEFGFIEVVCEFCGQGHQFDEGDISSLFSDAKQPSPGSDSSAHGPVLQ